MMTDTSSDNLIFSTVERFADEVLRPAAQAIDEESRFAGCHLPALSLLGLTGLNLPEPWGVGASATSLLECVAIIAGACGSTASMLTAHFLATDSLLIGASSELKQRYLPGAADGSLLGAFALTEPHAGSNPADLATTAVKEGDGYRICGSKQFISNAGKANFVVVFAKTDKNAGHRGISAFLVDTKTEGFYTGPAEKTMGLKGGHVFPLTFDCFVPDENLIGQLGQGFSIAMKVLDNGRLEVAAMAIGIARAALALSREWVTQRQVGGKSIAAFQGILWMLADMATDIAAAEQLALHAARLRTDQQKFTQESAMAKLFASEMVSRVTDKAIQVHGGYGYARDFPLERFFRDARIFQIYEGSSEIQRNIIARSILRD